MRGVAQVLHDGSPQVSRGQARRADRSNALRVLWRESCNERQRSCGKHIAPGNDLGVSVRVSGTGESRSAGWSGLVRCGLVWTCPECSAKIAEHRRVELETTIRRWQDMGHAIVHATFTVRHHKGQRLRTVWDVVQYAWTSATSGAGWIADQQAHGVLMVRTIKTGARAGETTAETRIPTVRLIEVTYGAHGWHVHVHALLFLNHLITDATADELCGNMFERWKRAAVRKGFATPLREVTLRDGTVATPGLTVRVCYEDAADTFGEYFTKAVFDSTPLAVSLEMARGDLKAARHGNRTPFELLRAIAGYTDYQDGDLEAWGEFERASQRRRQMTWSPGLRELVALPEEEKTDEEIAEEEHGGTTLAYVERRSWYRIVCMVPGLRARLLSAAEQDEHGHAFLDLCREHRVQVHVPDTWRSCHETPPRAA